MQEKNWRSWKEHSSRTCCKWDVVVPAGYVWMKKGGAYICINLTSPHEALRKEKVPSAWEIRLLSFLFPVMLF